MLALTKRTDYALIALAHLARRAGQVVSAREVAEVSGAPLPMLTNILKVLGHAGIVTSERGSRGGYCLARPAESISLDELITAIEGPVHMVRCMLPDAGSNGNVNQCLLETSCPVRGPAKKVYERLKSFLQSVTLAELGVEDGASTPLRQIHIEKLTATECAVTECAT